jgi:hypothetical protein
MESNDISILPEIVSTQEPSFDIFDPSNIHTYTDLWTKSSKFLRALPELSHVGLSVSESKDNVDKYSIVGPQGIVKDDLNEKQVAALMLLARYRSLIVNLTKKNEETVHDFFNELESYREYHARQLLALCSSEEDLNLEVKRLTIAKLDELDKSIYYMNRDSNLDAYEKVWVVNALMISMARWEIQEFKGDLYKENYISGIVGEDVSQLPSHLRILSRVIEKEKDKVLEIYPKSVLMNYSHFYPTHLYHTGREPLNSRNSLNSYFLKILNRLF